jgi:DNA-binding NtrC family response regulator
MPANKGLLNQAVESLEKRLLIEAIDRFHGNKTKAAIFLGLSRRGINKKLDRYGINKGDVDKRKLC